MIRLPSMLAACSALALAACVGLAKPTVPPDTRAQLPREATKQLLSQSSLVFDASVVERHSYPPFLGKKTPSGSTPSGREGFLLVKVETVHRGGDPALLRRGDAVWIDPLPSTNRDQVGFATWYARPWICGDGVVVQELGHDTGMLPTDEYQKLDGEARNDVLRARLRLTQQVVVGVVALIEPPPSAAKSVRDESRRGMSGHEESEHEPDWRVASIRVVRWLKYTPEGRIDSTSPKPESVRVQFAASRDFAWFKAPKLEEPKPPTPPEEFIFLLSRPSTVMPYVLTDPMDLLPMSELSDVERLLRG